MSNDITPITSLTSFWANIYASPEPHVALQAFDAALAPGILSEMDQRIYPEPFYGYLDGDITGDVLLLLINPGQVAENAPVDRINTGIIDRYTWWKQAEYLEYAAHPDHQKHDEGLQWRQKPQCQLERILGKSFGFLHTIEFFPYHSKRWAALTEEQKASIFRLTSTRLAIEAVRHIAEERKVKHILAIGKPWLEILQTFGLKPEAVVIRKTRTGGVAHRVYKFLWAQGALPIVIYISGAGAMSFPRAEEAVTAMRRFLWNEAVAGRSTARAGA